MKMAKASEADMSMAIEMAQALDALTNRWTPMMPEAIDQGGEEENERFDIDDETQCRRVVEYLLELADRASLFRVVFGMAVLLDPQNEIVDPAADHLSLRPGHHLALQFNGLVSCSFIVRLTGLSGEGFNLRGNGPPCLSLADGG